MSSGWNDYSHWTDYGNVHLNMLPVPAHEARADGRTVFWWSIETMEDLDDRDIASIVGLTFPSSMKEVRVDVLGTRDLRLTQVGGPNSDRMVGGPSAARMIDEEIARIWLIDGVPRSWYPVFMRQRRDLLSGLEVVDRRRSTWLGMLRSGPLITALTGSTANYEELTDFPSSRATAVRCSWMPST